MTTRSSSSPRKRHAEFGVAQARKDALENIHAHEELILAKTVANLLEGASAAVHGALALLRQVEARAHPLEIAGLAAVHAHIQRSWRAAELRRAPADA